MRWTLKHQQAITWTPEDCHTDDLEMAGFGCSDTVKYGTAEDGTLVLIHHPVFPTLRVRPNNTHASWQMDMPEGITLYCDGEKLREKPTKFRIDGVLHITSRAGDLQIHRTCYPAATARASFEEIRITNDGTQSVSITTDTPQSRIVGETMGPMGVNVAEITHDFRSTSLAPGNVIRIVTQFSGRLANESTPCLHADAELEKRRDRIRALTAPMAIDTGEAVLDALFTFSKLRAGESVFDTRYGKLHSPGGYSYYAATWCNDEVEYAGPYFAYTGDDALIEASRNAYRMYIPFMSESYTPIPSSVIAEGLDYWNGAGDRGDAAMYLYGASRFFLTCGDPEAARAYYPAILWCLEYCMRQKTAEGVIASDADELEGRFSHGATNLNTSCLCHSGLLYCAILAGELGDTATADRCRREAADLHRAIERVFGAELHGMDTYRYHEGLTELRSWICMPLCMRIFDRADGTAAALTSRYLLRGDGMLTAESSETIWDRSTLYALRGLFAAGHTDEAYRLLRAYSENRLLGERVPYPVEAYPEGGRRHLSGESALYCKIVVEGMLGLEPAGFRSFTVTPHVPAALDHLTLTNIHAHGGIFSIDCRGGKCTITGYGGTVLAVCAYGETAIVSL